MVMSNRRRRWSLLAALALILGALACRTPTEERLLSTQIADLEATRAALSTEVAELEEELPEERPEATTEPAATPTEISPTATPTPTEPPPTPTVPPPTDTPVLPQLSLALLGCSTGLDITHGLGEVTNAYVQVQNVGSVDAANVCLRLEASDVGEMHPDETRCVPLLPVQTQVALRLTADTEFGADTAITVRLTADQGATAQAASTSCHELDIALRWEIEAALDLIEPVLPD